MKNGVPVVLDVEETEAFIERVKAHALEDGDYDLVVAITEGYTRVTQALSEKEISISRLRSIIFGSSSEKMAAVFFSRPPSQTGCTSQMLSAPPHPHGGGAGLLPL